MQHPSHNRQFCTLENTRLFLEGSVPIPWRFRLPLERTARYRSILSAPFESLEVLDGPAEATLIAAGDLALNRANSFSATLLLGDVAPVWNQADARVANLETVCTARTTPAATIGTSLRADPAAIEFIRDARIDAVTVANNHSLDFGSDGLAESVELLHGAGVSVCGVSPGPGIPAAPAVFEVKGIRIGMLGYCDAYRIPADEPVNTAPATASPEVIHQAIAALRGTVDLVIVQMHWGYEFSVYPLLRHREAARGFVDAGAHIVLCHHAHVPMGVERYCNGVIAHGLGNWIFPPGSYLTSGHEWTQRSFLLRFAIGRDGVHSVGVVPFALHAGPRLSLLRPDKERFMRRVFQRLSNAIADTQWLRRVELCRTIVETFSIMRTLASCTEGEFAQRTRILRTPVNGELAESLVRIGGNPAAIGRLLIAAAEGADSPDVVRRLLDAGQATIQTGLEDLRRQYRWQDGFWARIP